MKRTTKRQDDVVKAIRTLTRRLGYPPTRSELAEHLGLRSTQSVDAHVNALIKKSVVEADANKARSLRVVDDREVPLIDASGKVDRAETLMSAERTIDRIAGSIADAFDPRPDCFLSSAVLAQALDGRPGDLIAMRTDLHDQEGATVAARIGEDISLRRLRRPHGKLAELIPLNTEEETVRIPEIALRAYIEGTVVGMLAAKPTPRRGGSTRRAEGQTEAAGGSRGKETEGMAVRKSATTGERPRHGVSTGHRGPPKTVRESARGRS